MDTKGNILMGKYEVGRLLGQGAFAKVYYGKHLKTDQSVAIKVIDKCKVAKLELMNQIEREIFVMRLVKHQNITQIYEVMATKTKIYFVIEYAKGGELFQKVTKKKLKEGTLRRYFQQLISAVNFCHKRGVYHRDLKPENLLLDEFGCLKVSDFGLSALSESKGQDGLLHTACGTPAYAAPEVICRKGYDGAKADIWSCGVILYVLLSGYLPFYDRNLVEMYRKIAKAEYKCPDSFSPQVRKLLSRMLDPNPQSRITIEKIMENPWFRKGLNSKPARSKEGDMLDPLIDAEQCGFGNALETRLELARPILNAFDIISLSSGLDLSGLFVTDDQKDEVQFTSTQPASTIMLKFEEIASSMKFKLTQTEKGFLKVEYSKGRGIEALSIDIEILEITPSFHLIEMKKSSGNTIEYHNVLKQDIRPALGEIIWAWQVEQRHQ